MSSKAGQNSLKGTGCLSYRQAGKVRKYLTGEEREKIWMEHLKKDMERASEYFWRQTPERRRVQDNYLLAHKGFGREGNDFIFGKNFSARKKQPNSRKRGFLGQGRTSSLWRRVAAS